ncbi:hypothetical protein ACM901_24050, partial [Escherichia coli]
LISFLVFENCDASKITKIEDFNATTMPASSYFSGDPKTPSSGSSSPAAQRHLPLAQHVVPDSAAHDTICCVFSLACDAPRRGGKQRYDDFLSVVHFRKVVICQKVGSDGNGSPVI